MAELVPAPSTLETIEIATGERKAVYASSEHFEAPNWLPDGSGYLVNSAGRLLIVATDGGTTRRLDTGFATSNNNDHGISPDGRHIAISHHTATDGLSRIYVVPITGGSPMLVTERGPSYWHGWSPDGRRLAYCAERGGAWDVYTIGVEGSEETRLTRTRELDDGPEFSPDGAHLYFNAFRDGRMQLWRMRTDGSQQTQLTFDAHSNWFPHPSPDGKWLAYLAYVEDQGDRHPAMQDVMVRLFSLYDGSIRTLARFTGGQGTLNVPSWSPDSARFAFVSYAPAR